MCRLSCEAVANVNVVGKLNGLEIDLMVEPDNVALCYGLSFQSFTIHPLC